MLYVFHRLLLCCVRLVRLLLRVVVLLLLLKLPVPHALPLAGQIIDHILEQGLEISALELFCLDRPAAEEFLEVYKGVVPEYHVRAVNLSQIYLHVVL